ncbi:MAG TPA: hypothetical protein VIL71_22880 [Spirillospora sp.]
MRSWRRDRAAPTGLSAAGSTGGRTRKGIGHRESRGVDASRMREVKRLMDRRITDGHGDEGFSSLFEALAR